ncbi:MAG: plasmid mobilization relaxosome protein MobC [bacterium]|nr:plasmid mobilization relaxosome protein MobC [bacterium]
MQTRVLKKQILVSYDEDRLIKEKAAQVGMTISNYMRTRALDYQPKEKPPKEFYNAIKEIRKVGINLNQIAHKANTFNFIDVPYYKKQVDILNNLIIEIKKKYLFMDKK